MKFSAMISMELHSRMRYRKSVPSCCPTTRLVERTAVGGSELACPFLLHLKTHLKTLSLHSAALHTSVPQEQCIPSYERQDPLEFMSE